MSNTAIILCFLWTFFIGMLIGVCTTTDDSEKAAFPLFACVVLLIVTVTRILVLQ